MPLALAIGFYLTLDARADVAIDIFPVLERAAQHGLAYTLQGGGDLLHQFAALFRVEDLPHEHAWLFKIVVVIAQRSEERRVGQGRKSRRTMSQPRSSR